MNVDPKPADLICPTDDNPFLWVNKTILYLVINICLYPYPSKTTIVHRNQFTIKEHNNFMTLLDENGKVYRLVKISSGHQIPYWRIV